MHRRGFIKDALVTALALSWRSSEASSQPSPVLPIEGADSTGHRDCTAAFQRLIASLPLSQAVFRVPPGRYRFAPCNRPLFHFKSFENLRIEGANASLSFEGETRPFYFEDCSQVFIAGLTVDWPRPPFSQGVIQQVGERWITVSIDSNYPVTGKESVETIGEYDPSLRIPVRDGLDQYGGVESISLVAPQTLRILLSNPTDLRPGATVVLRHRVYGIDIFKFDRCKNISFERVDLHAAPGMGILAESGSDFRFDRLRVLPPPGSSRLLSLNADAVHLTDCSGAIEFSHCEFKGMGDDAINICATFFAIDRSGNSASSKRWKLWARDNQPIASWRLPQPGASLQICDPDTLDVQGTATILSAYSQGDEGGFEVEGDESLKRGPQKRLIACDALNTTHTAIHDCTFGSNRARAIVAHNNTKIYNNRFEGQSLAAILLSADGKWMEGPVVQSVEISNNQFHFNYYGRTGFRRGAITIDTAHDPASVDMAQSRVNSDVSIHDNNFSASSGPAIFAARTSNLVLMRNTTQDSSQMLPAARKGEAIFLYNVGCSDFEENQSAGSEHVSTFNCDLPLSSRVGGNCQHGGSAKKSPRV